MLDFFTTMFGGAILVIGIIAGIGPQNLNTMSHAIRKNHEYAVATTCFLADTILILIGCIGISILNSPTINKIINIVGILFLSYYLFMKLRGLNQPNNVKLDAKIVNKKTAIIRALGLTWLNPLVFIDTIVVIGGVSASYIGINHIAFTLGAILGDFIWLFGLTFLSRTFADKLNRPAVWFMIDISTIILVGYVLIKILASFL